MFYNREGIISYLKSKYRHLKDADLDVMYDCAYDIMLNLRYPYHHDIMEIPEQYLAKHKTWILRAMEEHIEREGMNNVSAYSENGVSITFDKAGISKDLISEIKPLAKMGWI